MLCFNSRVRGGRDRINPHQVIFLFVSTHASAGDASTCIRYFNRLLKVSTHASAGDATTAETARTIAMLFQLTRPRGTRRLAPSHQRCHTEVSTHASAGDATTQRYMERETNAVSTHASAGDATEWLWYVKRSKAFQLTRPRGTRHLRAERPSDAQVSTHASAGDATTITLFVPRCTTVSTHASAGDATEARKAARMTQQVSTHASAGDATVVLKDVFMIALFRYFARRLRFGAFHDAQGR